MPFYPYLCNKCKKAFKAFHSPDEKHTYCVVCKSEDITRTISTVRTVNSKATNNNAKERVERFIEESRSTLEEQLKESRKDYKP